jgi:ABC-type phosphate transport system auxiliary subunit
MVLGAAALFISGGVVMFWFSVGAVGVGLTFVLGLCILLFKSIKGYFYPTKSKYLDE